MIKIKQGGGEQPLPYLKKRRVLDMLTIGTFYRVITIFVDTFEESFVLGEKNFRTRPEAEEYAKQMQDDYFISVVVEL